MRPTMLIAQLSTAASVALLGFMTDPVAIAVVAGLVGLASNASRPAVQAMMADIVAPEDRVRAFSLNYWAINLGFAISSTAAGLIAEHGYLALFLGESTLVLACALVVFWKLPESRPATSTPGGPDATGPAPAPVSMRTVLRDGRFMTVVGLNLLLALLFQQAYVSMPVSMGQDGFSSADFGLVIAVNGVLIVLLQIPVTRFIEHRSPALLLIGSALLAGYGFGLTALAGSVAMYAVAVTVWTLGEIINSPTQMGLVVRLSPLHGRGRYQGMYSLSWSVAALVAPLLGGVVIDQYGADALWAGLRGRRHAGRGGLWAPAPEPAGGIGHGGSGGAALPWPRRRQRASRCRKRELNAWAGWRSSLPARGPYGYADGRWVRCAKASRLRVDSPRETRQAYSLRIAVAKPISSRVLKLPSAFSRTVPRMRSRVSGVTAASGSLPTR